MLHRIQKFTSIILCGLIFTVLQPVTSISAVQPLTIEVDTLGDSQTDADGACSLREAIINANNADQSGSTNCPTGNTGLDVIAIQVPGQIVLSSNLATITDTLTINGNLSGTAISGADSYRIFQIVASSSTTTILHDLTIEHGRSTVNAGGGISKNGGTLEVHGCSFLSNQATRGGAISNGAGNTLIINSTFVGNSAAAGDFSNGGALSNGSGWSITIINSTFKGNSAFTSGSTLHNASGGITVHNSIIADGVTVDNCSGTIHNEGNNIDTGTSCNFGSTNGSMSSTNPLLGTLGFYGGPTQTVPLLPGSPAIDGVVFFPPNNAENRDQRGYWRPVDGDGDGIARYDIGAFEVGAAPIFLPVVMK